MRTGWMITCGLALLMTASTAGCGGGGTGAGTWTPPFSGRRAFIVSSQVATVGDGTGQRFTLVFDADRRIGIVGANKAGSVAAIEATANGRFRFSKPVTVSSRFAVGCPTDAVRYDELEFKIDAAGTLTGSGRGEFTKVDGGIPSSSAATMSLSGVPDTEGPTLGLYITGLGDQFTQHIFASSEPLPVDALPVARNADGDIAALNPQPGDAFNIQFPPAVLLPFEHLYTIDATRVVDFAGNRATIDGVLMFGTGSTPVLVTADGFESQMDMLLPGTAQFTSSSNLPIISGERSLYVAPQPSSGAFAVTEFALRLSIAPGATVLRFSYRTLSLANSASQFEYFVGSVGSPLVTGNLPADSGPGTTMSISGRETTVGPLTTATINLPAGATGEVVFARATRPPSCGTTLPGVAGVMIDDLRTE